MPSFFVRWGKYDLSHRLSLISGGFLLLLALGLIIFSVWSAIRHWRTFLINPPARHLIGIIIRFPLNYSTNIRYIRVTNI